MTICWLARGKATRMLAENAALVTALLTGDADLEKSNL